MTKYLAGVLSVIAAGVLLVAYGLLAPRTAAFNGLDPNRAFGAMPAAAGLQSPYPYGVPPAYAAPYAPAVNGYAAPVYSAQPYAQQVSYAVPPMQVVEQAQPIRAAAPTSYRPSSSRRAVVERAPRRDWKKTALVIGGSSAAGAGLGGIFGGKKGALIGAAIGGGASTLYEATKKGK